MVTWRRMWRPIARGRSAWPEAFCGINLTPKTFPTADRDNGLTPRPVADRIAGFCSTPTSRRRSSLIAVHGEDGALGLILNREMSMSIAQIWSQLSESTCTRQENVWHGGPVTGSLMALHDQPPMGNLVVHAEFIRGH